MQRATGLFLLAVASLFLILATIGMALSIGENFQGDRAHVMVFIAIPMVVIGGFLLYIAIRILRRTTPWDGDGPKPVEGRVGGYMVDTTETRHLGAQKFDVHYTAKKPKVPSGLVVRMTTATKSPVNLQCHEENWFDRLCKAWGIAREVQTGDIAFDQAIYVRCPSEAFAKQYLSDRKRRQAILALRKLGFHSIELNSRTVEAHWPNFNPEASPSAANAAAEHLAVLTEGIPATDSDKITGRVDGRLIAYAWLWMTALALACSLLMLAYAPPVRVWALISTAAAVFGCVYVIFGWIAARCLRGDSIAHDRWAMLMAFSVLLLGMGSVGMVTTINSLADTRGPEVRTATITYKRSNKGRRTTSYFVTVPDWNGGGQIECRVSRSEYDRVVVGTSRLEVQVGRGALGIEWLRSKKVLSN